MKRNIQFKTTMLNLVYVITVIHIFLLKEKLKINGGRADAAAR